MKTGNHSYRSLGKGDVIFLISAVALTTLTACQGEQQSDSSQELYVESFADEENALLNSEEPTHVEVAPFTGETLNVEKRNSESHSLFPGN